MNDVNKLKKNPQIVDKAVLQALTESVAKPYRIFAANIEDAALMQFFSAMSHPAAVQGAVMADGHSGYSLPIGGVVASEGVIFPSWVGYDKGCGVCSVPTSFKVEDVREHGKAIFQAIYRHVPVGKAHNPKEVPFDYDGPISSKVEQLLRDGARRQLGTLGGGNHFIEIGEDRTGVVWITIHSGSRNLGHQLGEHYMTVASDLDRIAHGLPPEGKAREGHYGLDVKSSEGRDYILDLAFAQEFALANRLEMVRRVERAMNEFVVGSVDYRQLINRHHNHAELNKDGLWVHRKGATHAEAGMLGAIPGTMATGVFIVRGKGSSQSLCSSSHGAGRAWGRNEIKRGKFDAEGKMIAPPFDMARFQERMQGIVGLIGPGTLDESPDAYKDIFAVMAQQNDLVEIVNHLSPIISVKAYDPDADPAELQALLHALGFFDLDPKLLLVGARKKKGATA